MEGSGVYVPEFTVLLSPVDRNSQQSVIGIEESFIRARQDWNPEDSLSESQGPAPEKRGFQHNLVFFFFWLPLACRVFPDQELNLWPMCWERRVLTTGLPGKSSAQVYVLSERKVLTSQAHFPSQFQNQAHRCTVSQHGLGTWAGVLGEDWHPRKRGASSFIFTCRDCAFLFGH